MKAALFCKHFKSICNQNCKPDATQRLIASKIVLVNFIPVLTKWTIFLNWMNHIFGARNKKLRRAKNVKIKFLGCTKIGSWCMCKFAKSHELGIVGLAELTVEKEECYKVCMSMVWFGLV